MPNNASWKYFFVFIRPRLVAASQNKDGIDESPVNAAHATAVMGLVLARGANDGDLTGMVPDARYITAEFLNRSGVPDLELLHVFDAAGFLVENGAEVINMSWAWFSDANDAKVGEAPRTAAPSSSTSSRATSPSSSTSRVISAPRNRRRRRGS